MTYAQVIHSLLEWLVPLGTIVALGLYLLLNRRVSSYIAQTGNVRDLKLEVAKLDGELGDLEDRFTRFQRRKGMQEAREGLTASKDLKAEADRIVAAGATNIAPVDLLSGQPMTKAQLRSRAFAPGVHQNPGANINVTV